MSNSESFQKSMQSAVTAIRKSSIKKAVVLHHDEADGLTSAALSKIGLEHLGLETKLICLDKLYPEVVQSIELKDSRVVAYVDLGSGHLDWLVKANALGSLILVLDHHDTSSIRDEKLHNLNPELYGFSGEKDASSATVAYMFCKSIDPDLSSYAHLAAIGSLELSGNVQGLNSLVVQDARAQGLVHESGKGDLRIETHNTHLSTKRAATFLNVLGSVGYYRQGPEIGVEACITGFSEQTVETAKKFEDERKIANRKMLSKINKDGLSQGKSVQWFHAHDTYKGMGGKVIGSFCSYLRFQRIVNPVKYLIGMMTVPPDVPGWGTLPSPLVKVSGRAPQVLTRLIEKGSKQPLSRILPDSCIKVGGFGDGHSVAASGVFPVGREEMFLREIDEMAD